MDVEAFEVMLDKLIAATHQEEKMRIKYNKTISLLRDLKTNQLPGSDFYRRITEVLNTY